MRPARPDAGPPPLPAPVREALRRGLAQYRTPAAAVGVYGALLIIPWAAGFWRDPGPAGAVAPALCASVLLLVLEFASLLWLNVGLELVPRGPRGRAWADRAKGLALAAALGLGLTVGLVSLRTGTRLSLADAWRYARNAVQLAQEATAWERTLLAAVPLAVLAAGVLLALAFHRERARDAGLAPRRVLLLTALAIAGLAGVGWRFAEAHPFRKVPLPEARLLAGRWNPVQERVGRLPRLRPEDLFGARIVPFAPPGDLRTLNVMVLMLEAVAWDHPSAWGGPAGVTPNLDALARECVRFPSAYAASTHSDYAQMAILSGLYPKKYLTHDFYDAIDYPRTLLWDVLKPCGYATAAFTCQNETWGNMIAFHRTPGLDALWHSPSWPDAVHRGSSIDTKVFEETPVAEWRRWKRLHEGEPTLVYLNFQSTHFSYEWPAGFLPLFEPFRIDFPASFVAYPRDKVPVMRNRFFNALHYADHWVGEVVRELKASGEWDRTLLLVVPDHGQAFYEHGFPTHGTSLHEEQVRTFALLHGPDLAPRTVDQPVSHLDLVPSLLRTLGLPRVGAFQGSDAILDPGYTAAGRPLFFSIQGLVDEDGILLDGWKYTLDWAQGAERLYDLRSDPGERENLAGRGRREEAALRDRLVRFQVKQINYYKSKVWTKGYYAPPAD